MSPDLNDLPAAVTEIEQNIDFLLHLPDHALLGKHRSELLMAHLWLARIHQIGGDRDAAEQALRAGLGLADKFLAGRPEETGWELAGIKLRVMLGNVLASKGELEAAVSVLRPATAMADHLAKLHPAEDFWSEDVDDPYYVLGLVLMQENDSVAGGAPRPRAGLRLRRAATPGGSGRRRPGMAPLPALPLPRGAARGGRGPRGRARGVGAGARAGREPAGRERDARADQGRCSPARGRATTCRSGTPRLSSSPSSRRCALGSDAVHASVGALGLNGLPNPSCGGGASEKPARSSASHM